VAKFNYGRMQKTASRLMARFAQGTVTLSRAGPLTPGENEWDEPQQSPPQVWTLDATVTGVDEAYVDGDTIKVTDQMVVASVFADEPKAGDILTVDGKVRTVLKIVRVPEAGPVVAWRIVIKG
jgi:hypothetical protein